MTDKYLHHSNLSEYSICQIVEETVEHIPLTCSTVNPARDFLRTQMVNNENLNQILTKKNYWGLGKHRLFIDFGPPAPPNVESLHQEKEHVKMIYSLI